MKPGHNLRTPTTCPSDHQQQCATCDHGLQVCNTCGAAEAELDEFTCEEFPLWSKADNRVYIEAWDLRIATPTLEDVPPQWHERLLHTFRLSRSAALALHRSNL